VIHAEGLSKSFGDRVAVDALTLSIQRGEVFGLLGPNGAGKTTTLRMLCALVAPTSGTAIIDGLTLGKDDEAIRSKIGLLTETPGLYPRLSARQNLELFAELYGVSDVDGQVRRYLELFDLWDRRDDLAGGFSKGMRQKVAIARALLHEPPILFLDEPTSGLDPASSRVVRELVERVVGDEGRTVILCTHNMDEADRLCDRIAFFKRRVLEIDAPDVLRKRLYGEAVRVRLREVTEEILAAVRALEFVREIRAEENEIVVRLDDVEARDPELVRALVRVNADVVFVQPELESLEQVYLDVIEREDEK
jgi:ABC-2 type transport system ATP-binding protein